MLSVAAIIVMPFIVFAIVAVIAAICPEIITSIKAAVSSLTTTIKMVLAKINLPLIYQNLITSLVMIGMLSAIVVVIDFIYRHYRH